MSGKPSTLPAGQQPPPRAFARWVLRLLLTILLLLLFNQTALLSWADQQPVMALPSVSLMPNLKAKPAPAPATTTPKLTPMEQLRGHAASIVKLLLRGQAQPVVRIIGVGGLGIVLVDLSYAALVLVLHTTRSRRQGRTLLRIRVPRLAATSGRVSTGADLLRALHGELASGQRMGAVAPWLTLLLTARPDEPVELGIAVNGGTDDDRESWAAAIRKTVQGLAPDGLIEHVHDPLAAACVPGRVVLRRTWRLRLSAAFPLRLHDDQDGSDLMGPLVAALSPRTGVVATQVQLVLVPRTDATDTQFARGWRAAAYRRYLRLSQRREHALSADAKALETKLHGPVFNTTMHAVTVAEDQRHALHARAELNELDAVMRQYAARSASAVQRWAGAGHARVAVPTPAPPRGQRLVAIGSVVAGVLTRVLLHRAPLHVSTFGAWVSPPPAVTMRLPMLLATLLPLVVALLVMYMGQRRTGRRAAIQLQQVLAAHPRAEPPAPLLWIARAWRMPPILGPDELSGMWHLPTAALGRLVRTLPCRYLPPPPHAFLGPAELPVMATPVAEPALGRRRWGPGQPVVEVPPLTATSVPTRLIIGIGRHHDGTEGPVGLPLRDGRQGLAFTAPPGVGKTQLASNLSDQLRPCGFFQVDGKGDDAGNLVEVTRSYIPLEDEDRLLILDVLDAEWPIGVNPLAGIDLAQTGAADQVLGLIEGIFARLDPDTWGKAPRMKNYLRKATLLVLYGEAHPTLAHVKQCLLDATYREQLLPRCANVEVRDFWAVEFPRIGEQQRASLDALVSRFDMLLDSELTRYLFNQSFPQWTFEEAIANRWIVLAPIPHRTLGGLAGPVGMLLFQAFIRAAFNRPGSDQTRAEYGFIGDEFQVLVENADAKDVRDALTQVRAFGIVTIIANQLQKQLGDLAEYALTAISNRIILRTQEPDASLYAKQYAESGITATDISGQEPREHQYAWIGVHGQLTKLFSMRPLPWLAPRMVAVTPEGDLDWQHCIPADSPCPQFDRAICDLMYGELSDMRASARALADARAEQWTALMTRWDCVRRFQHAFLCAHPGCIPGRMERQQWLSRLRGARRRVIAEAEYARIRRAIDPATGDVRTPVAKGGATRGSVQAAAAVEPPIPNFAHVDPRRPDNGGSALDERGFKREELDHD